MKAVGNSAQNGKNMKKPAFYPMKLTFCQELLKCIYVRNKMYT